MIDIEVDRTLGRDMLDVLREVRLIRLRNGALLVQADDGYWSVLTDYLSPSAKRGWPIAIS
jgi:hypothetical protein